MIRIGQVLKDLDNQWYVQQLKSDSNETDSLFGPFSSEQQAKEGRLALIATRDGSALCGMMTVYHRAGIGTIQDDPADGVLP